MNRPAEVMPNKSRDIPNSYLTKFLFSRNPRPNHPVVSLSIYLSPSLLCFLFRQSSDSGRYHVRAFNKLRLRSYDGTQV